MIRRMLRIAVLLLLVGLACGVTAQDVKFADTTMPYTKALDTVLSNNVLTYQGVPFHALLKFAPKDAAFDPTVHGTIELYWATPNRYRLILNTPAFGQTLIVDGDKVQEDDRGDFYPTWLQSFVTALLDPLPRLKSIRERPNNVSGAPLGGGLVTTPCIARDDKTNGITNDLTWARICLEVDRPWLDFAQNFGYFMEFTDFRAFHAKQIAHVYTTEIRSNDSLIGNLTVLEDWTPKAAMLTVNSPTPASGRILTTLVSTAQEESMVERKPDHVIWPSAPDGKASGYMIVEAVTDRTGQVRETSKHNSDNPSLEGFGREVALKYKFKPLIIDGVPQQMIMPLVLHFETTIMAPPPLPSLDDAATRARALCTIPRDVDDEASSGKRVELEVTIAEDGSVGGAHAVNSQFSFSLWQVIGECHFKPLVKDGKPVRFKGHIAANAK